MRLFQEGIKEQSEKKESLESEVSAKTKQVPYH